MSTAMRIFSFALISGALACATPGAAQAGEALMLRADPVASGPMITLGDLFENAGPAAAQPVSPAPRRGGIALAPTAVVQAAVEAAGLTWTPPQAVAALAVSAPADLPARTRAARAVGAAAMKEASPSGGGVIVRRGDPVTVSYAAAGVQLSLRARALDDAGHNQIVRLQNIQSDAVIEARVSGPGIAHIVAP